MGRTADRAFEGTLLLLLFGLPFSLGAVEPWGYGAMEVGVALLLVLFLLRGWARGRILWYAGPLNLLLLLLLLLPLLQLVPLPPTLLGRLSGQAPRWESALASFGHESSWRALAVNGALLREELLRWIAYGLTFLLVLNWSRDVRRVRRLFFGFALMGASLTIFALVQLAFWNGKIFWRIETASAFPFGPYVNHNHFAGIIELTLGATLGLLLERPGTSASPHRTESFAPRRSAEASSARMLLLWGLAALLCIGILLSRSRGGVVSLIGAGAIVPLLLRHPDSRRALLGILLTLALLMGGVLALGSGVVGDRYRIASDPSVQYRLAVWRDTLALIRDQWLLGCGVGNFAEVFPAYKSGFAGFFTVHPENEYLQAMAELGIVGASALLLLLLVYARRLFTLMHRRRDTQMRGLTIGGLFGLTAFLLHGLYDFNFHIPANAFAFAVLAAMTLAAAAVHPSTSGTIALRMRFLEWTREHSPRVLLSLVVGGCVGAGGYAALALRDAIHHQQFLAWFQTFRLSSPEEAWRGDERLIPGYEAEMRHWRARQLFDLGRSGLPRLQQYAFFERAAELAHSAVRERPTRGRYWALYAMALAEVGEHERARRAFEWAVAFDPSNAEIRYDRARHAVVLRDLHLAVSEFARARELDPRLDLTRALDLLAEVTDDPTHLRRLVIRADEEETFTAWYRRRFARATSKGAPSKSSTR